MIVITALVLAGSAILYLRGAAAEARLLRADPDAILADRAMARLAEDRGRAVFDDHCASCHKSGGVGDPATGVPNLGDGDWLYGSGTVGEIERTVTYGIRSHRPKAWNLAVMPAFARATPAAAGPKIPRLGPRGIADVVEFLVAASGRPADPDAARRGRALYGDDGGCYDCHGPDGGGDSAIGAPDLIDGIWLYGDGSREAIARSIADGRQGICPGWIGSLDPGRIRAVAVYVYSLSHPATQTAWR